MASIPKPPDTSQDQELFANMLIALQGVTVLAEPRVSRETMLEVLREHTTMLKSCRAEVATIGSIVRVFQFINETFICLTLIKNALQTHFKTSLKNSLPFQHVFHYIPKFAGRNNTATFN